MKFIMMIGFPGSGKSTYASKLAEQENAAICSSDALRKELYGSEEVQEHNEEVFQILMQRVKQFLADGVSVIYDAMNISSKYRRNTLRMLSKYECEKIAYLIATPYEMCLERNNQRERHVPEDVIKHAYMNFNVPCSQEGFDKVEIVYPDGLAARDYMPMINEYKLIPHDNPHHSATIGNHMLNAYHYLEDHHGKDLEKDDYSLTLDFATLLHDIGKPFTKTFTNSRGEPTEIAHYFNHNFVGAYEVLFIDMPAAIKLDVALLIQYHMHYYLSWKQSEEAEKKDRAFLGKRLSKLLDILHDCDQHGK